MRIPRAPGAMLAAVSIAAAISLCASPPAGAATASHKPYRLADGATVNVELILEAFGLGAGYLTGYLYGEGPATAVLAAAKVIKGLGIGETVLFTGSGETGTGEDIISGTPKPGTCIGEVIRAVNIDNLTQDPITVEFSGCGGAPDGSPVPPGADENLPSPTAITAIRHPDLRVHQMMAMQQDGGCDYG